MNEETERAGIRAAMDRLLAGIPLHSDGALTIVSLAEEAQVKRHVLTHRHVDLKDEFYAKVRARGHVPDSERKLREELAQTKRRLEEANGRIAELEGDVEGLARVVNVLTVENDQLRERMPEAGVLRLLPSTRSEAQG
ncbi:hypothetical protein [Catenulispora subtropica]|uniref:Uncharacterized protein n=1 Tax=Catenulispora subtropica TaxID=450798 RepID=A0ABN2R4G5_9ACTN